MDNQFKSSSSADAYVNKSSTDCAKYISQLQKWYTTEARKLQNDIVRANMQLEATRNQCGTMINEVKKRQAELEMEVVMLKNDDHEKAMGVVTGEIDYVSQRESLVDRLKEIKMEIDCLSTQVNRIRTVEQTVPSEPIPLASIHSASESRTSVNHGEPSCSTGNVQKTVDEAHECGVCQLSYINRVQLVQHISQFSMEQFLREPEWSCTDNDHIRKQLYFCHITDCRMTFQQADQLKQHMQMHIQQSYTCEHCSIRFPSYSLQVCAHERTCNPVKLHECKDCKRRFASDKMLKIHLFRGHSIQSPHDCSNSGCKKRVESAKGARWRGRFKHVGHTRTHDGHCTHLCHRSNCSKIFKSVAALRVHLKNHRSVRAKSRKMNAPRNAV